MSQLSLETSNIFNNILDEEKKKIIRELSEQIQEKLKEKTKDNITLLKHYAESTDTWLKTYMKYAEESYYAKRGVVNESRKEIERILKEGLQMIELIRTQLIGEDIFYLMIEIKNIPYIKKRGGQFITGAGRNVSSIDDYFDNFLQDRNGKIELYMEKDISNFLKPSQASISKKDPRKGRGILGSPIFNLNKTEIIKNAEKIKKAEEEQKLLEDLEEQIFKMEQFFISSNLQDFYTQYINKNNIGLIKNEMSNRNRYLQWLKIEDIPIKSGTENVKYTRIKNNDSEEKEVKKWRKNKKVQWFSYSQVYNKAYKFNANTGIFFEAYMHAIDLNETLGKGNWNIDDAFIAASNNLAFFKGADSVYAFIKSKDSIKQLYNFQQKVIDNASISGNTVFNSIVVLNSILTEKDWRENNDVEYIPNPPYGPYRYEYYKPKESQNINLEQQLVAFFTDYFSKS